MVVLYHFLLSSVVDQDQNWSRIQKLCGSGSTQVKIGQVTGKICKIEDKNSLFSVFTIQGFNLQKIYSGAILFLYVVLKKFCF